MFRNNFIFSNSLKKDLEEVDKLIFNISEGDLTQTLYKKLSISSLQFNINNLIKKFRGLIAQIMTMTDKTINYASELKVSAENIKISSRENSKIINEISQSMETQMILVKKAKDYSNELINDAKNIAEKSEIMKKMEHDAVETVSDSYKNFEELINKMHQTAISNVNTSKKIKSLEEKIYLIQNIADQVTKISKSTNLLALNASIEASRAGESGKGFAVVADEVGKLATSSTIQAKQIENIVSGIKQEIILISSSMENEIKSIDEYINSSKITKQQLNKIKLDTNLNFNAFVEINTKIETQVTTVNKINKVVEDVCTTFENISISTEEIATASEHQYKTTESTFDKLLNLTTMNQDIKHYVNSFIKNYKIDDAKQKYINNGITTLKKVANILELKTMDYTQCTPILINQLEKHPYFELIALMQKDGLRKAITLDYSEQEVYVNFSHRPYFKKAISGDSFISEPYISVDTNNYCIAMSVPIKSNNGDIIGILMADLKL